MPFSIMTLGIPIKNKTLSTMPFSMMKLSMTIKNKTLSINDTQESDN
jgi:hypothetical protein